MKKIEEKIRGSFSCLRTGKKYANITKTKIKVISIFNVMKINVLGIFFIELERRFQNLYDSQRFKLSELKQSEII